MTESEQRGSTFQPLHFRAVMGFILFGHLENQTEDRKDWLQWLFYSSQKSQDVVSNPCLNDDDDYNNNNHDNDDHRPAYERNQVFLWNWVAWETARFCIVNKLRSPLGKALDTFVAVENVLKSYAHQLKGVKSLDRAR